MNITKLNEDCKIIGRKVFEAYKHHLENYPLENKINLETIEAIILYEVRQEFGRKVLKNHVTGNETPIQLKKMQGIVNGYLNTIIKTCYAWGGKFIKT